MKKFLEFINEDLSYDEIEKLIKNDCSPYLMNEDTILYRGFKPVIDDVISVKRRKGREPVDMPVEIHLELDDMFYEEFGWRVRSEGVFVTTSIQDAKQYMPRKQDEEKYIKDEPYIFIPKGEYRFVYHPDIDDLFSYYEAIMDDNYDGGLDWFYNSFFIDEFKDKKLENARGVEVIFDCNNYYLFNNKHKTTIEKILYTK